MQFILKTKKKFRVYSNRYYNRFVYKSNTRIERDDFTPYEESIIAVLDTLLFKGLVIPNVDKVLHSCPNGSVSLKYAISILLPFSKIYLYD